MTTTLSPVLAGTSSHPTCRACPWLETCSSSEWNEGRLSEDGSRVVHPHDKGVAVSQVHTCRTCMDRSLTMHDGEPSPEKRVVPASCPRWRLMQGSACDCNSCTLVRDEYRRARRPVRDGLFAEWIGAVVAGKRAEDEFGPRYFDPDGLREKERLSKEVSETFDPTKDLLADIRRGKVESWVRAKKLLDVLLSVVWTDPTFERDRMDNAESWSIDSHVTEWFAALHWAMESSGSDATRLGRLWMLSFTDQPLGARSWSRWTVDRRKQVLESWQGLIDERVEVVGAEA